jgi:DNA (cytosine-5)-methyltransferase 1
MLKTIAHSQGHRGNAVKNRPIGIDLFSGAGGLSLGFEQAGFDIAAAVEIDPIHAAIHKFNFPDCTVFPRSIVGLSGAEIRNVSGIGRKRVDVVFGGAPCQGFSLIGHRALEDPRNSLVKEFVRIVSELDASYFVFENVKGLTVGRHRQFLDEVIGAFQERGYRVRLPWRVLNAQNYGVPQDRERLILIGAKPKRALPAYPTPTTLPAGLSEYLLKVPRKGPSVQEALSDLPDAERYSELLEVDEVLVSEWGEPSAYARELRCLSNNAWHFGYPRIWDPALLTSSIRTDHSPISRRRFAETEQGAVEPISRFFKLPADGVSNTLRAGTDSARGAFTSPRPIHYRWNRCITVREMARLHGFPDWFRFHETKWHGARQIGNAVPPPLARAVAESIIEVLECKREGPSDSIALGDPALLRIGMAEAAAYWGIEAPIGRRDRKSGAKKRSQAETERARLATIPQALNA